MKEPDWALDYHQDFWDTSHGRIVGQCRVHVEERDATFFPKGYAGALAMDRYTGERITVSCQADGKRVAYRDDWNTDGHSYRLRGVGSFKGWTYLLLKDSSTTPANQGLRGGMPAREDFRKKISEAPKIRAEGKATPPEALILTDRQVFRGAQYVYGPAEDRGPPLPSMRKRVVLDMQSREVLLDQDFSPAVGMSKTESKDLFPILDRVRDLEVYLWYYSATGLPLIDVDRPADRSVAGTRPAEVPRVLPWCRQNWAPSLQFPAPAH